jgi:hypothetical protein
MWLAQQVLAGLILGVWLVLAVGAVRGRRLLPWLAPGVATSRGSRVSAIVPARNEGRALPWSVSALLAQAYADFEVIVVDDRSTDDTPAILSALAAPRLTAIRVDTLPAGWLGKNHALYLGSRRARGDWLLFTDADVMFHPGCLAAAVAHAESEGLDHLSLSPRTETRGFWEPVLIACFGLLFALVLRPWRAADPRSRAFVGIGAFNLIRRQAYERIGTHRALATAVVDDLELGRLVKRHRLRQALARGERLLSVRWQVGLRGIVVGLEKNGFAAVGYSLPKAVVGCLGLALLMVVPPVAAVVGPGGLWLPAAVVPLVLQAGQALDAGLPLWAAALQPLGGVVLIVALLRSAALTLRRGGVQWRGTVYPVRELDNAGPLWPPR